MMLVILMLGIDLLVGFLLVLIGVVAVFIVGIEVNVLVVVAAVFVLGVVIGVVIGVIVVKGCV